MDNQARYKRQIILPEIGAGGQEKLSNASILVIGAGGLGCPALLYLAAAGVGHIGIIDFDKVDETNLQRQVLFKTHHIGRNKAEVAAKELSSLNPDIKIESFAEELTDKNAKELFNRFDIVIDGSDNFATKYLINDAAVKTNTPFIYGSILGFDGQISVFNANDNAPCYRCLFPKAPEAHIPNCAEAGVIGAVAGIIGTSQAMEAIKLIVAHKNFTPLIGKLWIIDMLSMENRLLSLSKDPNCPICSKNKDDIMLNNTPKSNKNISEISTVQLIKDIDKYTLLDVREQNEWDLGHIEGAYHLPLSSMNDGSLPDIAKDKKIVVYCLAGIRSKQAAILLEKEGFSDLTNMSGGYEEWVKYTQCLK